MRQIYCDRVGCQMLQLIPSATSRSRPGASSLHSRTSIYLSLLMRDSNPWPRGGSSVLSRQYGSVAKMSLPGLMCMKLVWKSAIYKHIVLRWHCPVALQVCGHVLFAQARMAPLRCRQFGLRTSSVTARRRRLLGQCQKITFRRTFGRDRVGSSFSWSDVLLSAVVLHTLSALGPHIDIVTDGGSSGQERVITGMINYCLATVAVYLLKAPFPISYWQRFCSFIDLEDQYKRELQHKSNSFPLTIPKSQIWGRLEHQYKQVRVTSSKQFQSKPTFPMVVTYIGPPSLATVTWLHGHHYWTLRGKCP